MTCNCEMCERGRREQEQLADARRERLEIEMAVERAMGRDSTKQERAKARRVLRRLLDVHYGAA